VTFSVTDSYDNTVANTVMVTTAGSDYTPFGPTRLLDTRYGTGAPKAKVQPHTSATVQIGGNHGIPTDVTAVVLNVTVTNTSANGYITSYGDGEGIPSTSNLDYAAHTTIPNQVIVPTGPDGAVGLYNGGSGPVDLIADIAGYFTRTASSGYTPLTPDRLIDTRYGTGTTKQQLAGGSSLTAQIAGNDGGLLPTSGVTAVALNVTVTGSKAAGYLSVYPDGTNTPLASNVNFTVGQTVANAVISPVGADGRIRVYNGGSKPASVIVDVVGYYSAAGKSAYLPIAPTRLLDTRASTWTSGPLRPGGYIYMPLSNGYPDITGFVLNSTVTETTGDGYLTVSPDPNTMAQYQNGTQRWPAMPAASTLNWLPRQTVANLVQANDGANGIIDFWNTGTGNIALIVDAFGYYQND
jgi:hypothetical protein